MAEKKAEKKSEVDPGDIAAAIRHWFRIGKPEHANRLRELRDSGDPIPYELLDLTGIKSEKPVEGKLEMPTRSGRGSGLPNWRKFAKQVSDLDDAVLDTLQRDEIIDILETRNIIPTLEEEREEEAQAKLDAKSDD